LHVKWLDIHQGSDQEIWEFASSNSFAIITKDTDFVDLARSSGLPPKVIWIAIGNSSTTEIEHTLRAHSAQLFRFLESSDESLYVITQRFSLIEDEDFRS